MTFRSLVLSHGHPDLNPGGAEHVAYLMFDALRKRPGCEAIFVAAHGGRGTGHDTTPFAAHGSDGREVLMRTQCEYFRFRQDDATNVSRHLTELLNWFQPDVVHAHHYTNFGVELFRIIRNWSASVPIVVTLHEYLAICSHNGQMVKTSGFELCNKATPSACVRCYPERVTQDFFLRESYIKAMFDCVDTFVCPSQFLHDRYAAWGLSSEKLVVLENGQEPVERLPSRPLKQGEPRGRFCYLGQLNPYKGVDVLLEAIQILVRRGSSLENQLALDVHGWNLDTQSLEFQTRMQRLFRRTRDHVSLQGRYRREDLGAVLKAVDWVVVPSRWWENSPMVIQEAFKYGRPVIASNLGGMKEKVTDGVSGLLVPPGSPAQLADCLERAAGEVGLWDRLRAGLPSPPTVDDWVEKHLALYDRISRQRHIAAV